jgi:hypothetical protein
MIRQICISAFWTALVPPLCGCSGEPSQPQDGLGKTEPRDAMIAVTPEEARASA